jgi:hypothetical protein
MVFARYFLLGFSGRVRILIAGSMKTKAMQTLRTKAFASLQLEAKSQILCFLGDDSRWPALLILHKSVQY